MDEEIQMNNFNKNFIVNNQNNKTGMNQIEQNQIGEYDMFKNYQNNNNNNITQNQFSSQTNDKAMLKNFGLDFINDNNSLSYTPSNSGEINPPRQKQIEYTPLRNPNSENTNEGTKDLTLTEKQVEFTKLISPNNESTISTKLHLNPNEFDQTKVENKNIKNVVPPFLTYSINPQKNAEYNINASIKEPEQNIKSVECMTVPQALTQGTNIYGLYPKPAFSGIQINAKAILNSLTDQKTTILLQKILIDSDNEQIKSIVKELQGKYRQLILDKNGNFFCKDLFKICDQKERIAILQELSPTLSEDCCNNFGTHPIQILVEFSSCEEEYRLILYSFNDYNKLLFATVDPNGAYVIQKIISRIPERFRAEFNFIFSSFISFVCKQKYGIVTVKKFIEYTKSENITQQILILIKTHFMNFAVDKYGNYLLQFLLEKWNNTPEGKEIKDLIFNNFSVMIKSKYSSFVCEIFVKLLNIEEKNQIIKTLDLNEIKSSNNPHEIKILKNLGIFINNETTGINNFQNQIQLPLSLNNNMNNNMNNNGNNNYNGNRNYNYRPNNNNKYKRKK